MNMFIVQPANRESTFPIIKRINHITNNGRIFHVSQFLPKNLYLLPYRGQNRFGRVAAKITFGPVVAKTIFWEIWTILVWFMQPCAPKGMRATYVSAVFQVLSPFREMSALMSEHTNCLYKSFQLMRGSCHIRSVLNLCFLLIFSWKKLRLNFAFSGTKKKILFKISSKSAARTYM